MTADSAAAVCEIEVTSPWDRRTAKSLKLGRPSGRIGPQGPTMLLSATEWLELVLTRDARRRETDRAYRARRRSHLLSLIEGEAPRHALARERKAVRYSRHSQTLKSRHADAIAAPIIKAEISRAQAERRVQLGELAERRRLAFIEAVAPIHDPPRRRERRGYSPW